MPKPSGHIDQYADEAVFLSESVNSSLLEGPLRHLRGPRPGCHGGEHMVSAEGMISQLYCYS